MSIISVTERFIARPGEVTVDNFNVTRTFQVISDTSKDDSTVVMFAIDPVSGLTIPAVHEVHPTKLFLWVEGISASVTSDDGCTWQVLARYGIIPAGEGDEGAGTEPWDMKPVINYSFVSKETVFERAYHKSPIGGPLDPIPAGITRDNPVNPVVNSVGQAFDPPPTIRRRLLLIVIQRNEQGVVFDPNDLGKFIDTVNIADIQIGGIAVKQFTGLMQDIKAVTRFTGTAGELYFSVTHEILVDPRTHIRRIIDQGFFEDADPTSVSIPTKLKQIRDIQGDHATDPVLLNGFGVRLVKDADLVSLDYHGYFEENWAPLSLPPNKSGT